MEEWRNVEAWYRLIVVCAEHKNVGAILVIALLYLIAEMDKGRTRLLKRRTRTFKKGRTHKVRPHFVTKTYCTAFI